MYPDQLARGVAIVLVYPSVSKLNLVLIVMIRGIALSAYFGEAGGGDIAKHHRHNQAVQGVMCSELPKHAGWVWIQSAVMIDHLPPVKMDAPNHIDPWAASDLGIHGSSGKTCSFP